MSDETKKPEVDPRMVTQIRGAGNYATYEAKLDLAHQLGLRSIMVEIVQIPTKENGGMAICKAVVTMKEGGVFSDVADCGPATTTQQLAAAALRLASTRAKARALADAVNLGEIMVGEEEAAPGPRPEPAGRAAGSEPVRPAPGAPTCSFPDCGKAITQAELQASQRDNQRRLCREHNTLMNSRKASPTEE